MLQVILWLKENGFHAEVYDHESYFMKIMILIISGLLIIPDLLFSAKEKSMQYPSFCFDQQ